MLLACLLGFTRVAAMPADSLGPPADAVQLRSFDEAALDAYRADPAYDYERIAARPPRRGNGSRVALPPDRRPAGQWCGTLRIAQHLLPDVAAGLLLAIWVLRKGGLQRVFGGDLPVRAGSPRWRRTSGAGPGGPTPRGRGLRRPAACHPRALPAGPPRGLVDRGLLHWSPDHTDRDYLAQLKDPGLQERFARAAHLPVGLVRPCRSGTGTLRGAAATSPTCTPDDPPREMDRRPGDRPIGVLGWMGGPPPQNPWTGRPAGHGTDKTLWCEPGARAAHGPVPVVHTTHRSIYENVDALNDTAAPPMVHVPWCAVQSSIRWHGNALLTGSPRAISYSWQRPGWAMRVADTLGLDMDVELGARSGPALHGPVADRASTFTYDRHFDDRYFTRL